MYRWDIINYLIDKYQYKTYLEIGYYKGWSFDKVNCAEKTAVDPNPCKTVEQEKFPNGVGIAEDSGIVWKMTSDAFFKEEVGDKKYDIIFIDGLHEAGQVYKDLMNAIRHLNEEGTILMHDCNPPTYEHTTTGVDGAWTGDTWKAMVQFRRDNYGTVNFTLDTDWGVAVIQPYKMWQELEASHSSILGGYCMAGAAWDEVPDDIDWEFFDKNRRRLLNLKDSNFLYEYFSDNV